jgi:hypothetical protein
MTFPEIFENFKNHSYIHRKSWAPNVFVQLRYTVPLIRLVMLTRDDVMIHVLDNDIKFTAEDLLADDWVDIDEL